MNLVCNMTMNCEAGGMLSSFDYVLTKYLHTLSIFSIFYDNIDNN